MIAFTKVLKSTLSVNNYDLSSTFKRALQYLIAGCFLTDFPPKLIISLQPRCRTIIAISPKLASLASDTRHTTHDTLHTTHDTRHTTADCRQPTAGQPDSQTASQTARQPDSPAARQPGSPSPAARQPGSPAARQPGSQAARQPDQPGSQAARQADRQTDRQTDAKATNIHGRFHLAM